MGLCSYISIKVNQHFASTKRKCSLNNMLMYVILPPELQLSIDELRFTARVQIHNSYCQKDCFLA